MCGAASRPDVISDLAQFVDSSGSHDHRGACLGEELRGSFADAEELFVIVATSYLDVYRVFGRELNIWSLLAGQSGLDPEAAVNLVGSAGRLLGTVGTAIGRLAREQAGVAEEDLGLVLPLAWSTVTGLADHFSSVRQSMHSYSWDQLVRFAARNFVRGLTSAAEQQLPANLPAIN